MMRVFILNVAVFYALTFFKAAKNKAVKGIILPNNQQQKPFPYVALISFEIQCELG